MTIRLYVVNNSHPCAAVARALELKGLAFTILEWPPPLHVIGQRALFGSRTVPGLTIGRERIHGSRAIFRRLDELVPEPRLYPVSPAARAAVEAADLWGHDVLQPVVRELFWAAAKHRPDALVSFATDSRLPLPPLLIRALAPGIIAAEQRMNRTGDARAAAALATLPEQVGQIDGWIADGTIGDVDHPNAAALQILSSVRLLASVADARPYLRDSPAPELANRLFGGPVLGEMPAGALAAA